MGWKSNPPDKATNEKASPTIKRVKTDEIVVAGKFRALDEEIVSKLAESIQAVGLLHLPTVYISEAKDDSGADEVRLVAGQHRLKAVQKLGWKYIDVLVVGRNSSDNRSRQITENLHRNNLSKHEEGQELLAWLEERLGKESGQGAHSNDKGISAAARKFGKSRRTIRRLLEAGAIKKDAALALKKAGLDNNGRVLEEVAHLKPEKQLLRVKKIVERREEQKEKRKGKSEPEADQKGEKKRPATKSPPIAPSGTGSGGVEDTPYDKLMTAWEDSPDFRKAWAEATQNDRDRFYEEVLDSEDLDDETADEQEEDA